MSIITLTSDFGNKDYQVPAIKGTIASLNTEAKVVDITHEVAAHNLLETVHIIKNSYPYFPKGSIHIICVDSFYHKQRKNILVKADDHYFICADNGLISLLFTDIKLEAVYEITLNNRFDDVVHFTSTDIFAPCAVHLQKGGLPELIGRKTEQIHTLQLPSPSIKENTITGQIMYIDHYENAITNIHRYTFETKLKSFRSFAIKVRFQKLTKIYNNYSEMVSDWSIEKQFHGKEGFMFNRQGYLTFFIYKGYKNNGAKTLFRLAETNKIHIEFSK